MYEIQYSMKGFKTSEIRVSKFEKIPSPKSQHHFDFNSINIKMVILKQNSK